MTAIFDVESRKRPARKAAIKTVNTSKIMLAGAEPQASKGIFRRAIEEFPSQSIQLVSLPVVVICMAASSGLGVFQKLANAVALGDLMGTTTLAVASIYAVVSASSISQMKEAMRATDHDRAFAVKMRELADKIEMVENHRRHDGANGIESISADIQGIEDRLDRLVHEQVARKHSESFTLKNVAEVWSNYAPESTLYAVGGGCRLDIFAQRQADGSLKLIPDYQRLLSWLKRYGPGGIARCNLIMFPDDASRAPAGKQVSRQIACYLTAFRALKVLAKLYNVPLRLDCIRFYMQKSINARQSFFVGTCPLGGKNVDFVVRYCDFAAMYNVPRTLLDDDVEVQYSPDAAAKYRNLAEMLMTDVPSLSLEEMEARYGHLVPHPPEPDALFIDRNPIFFGPSIGQARLDQIVVNGDHFVI